MSMGNPGREAHLQPLLQGLMDAITPNTLEACELQAAAEVRGKVRRRIYFAQMTISVERGYTLFLAVNDVSNDPVKGSR